MKPLKSPAIWIVFCLLLWNCSGQDGLPGPIGPQGPQGQQGPPGPSTIGLMYETVFTLNGDNQWSTVFEFPQEDEIFTEDVVLTYLLWEQTEGDNPVDIWRLMPVSYFTSDGLLQINYDFTVNDVRIFAEAAFDLDPAIDVFDDFLARIVVVPADYSPNARVKNPINFENYEEVKAAFQLPDERPANAKPFMDIVRAAQ